jgi:hypothetical protein
MNDILAVQPFSVENLPSLTRIGDVSGAHYLAPFVAWYAAIAIPDLRVSLRLNLLTVSFAVCRDWFRIAGSDRGSAPGGKFFTEKIDLVRYLHTILFLHVALGLTRLKISLVSGKSRQITIIPRTSAEKLS